MAKLHKRKWLPSMRINSQVWFPRLNARADGRMEENLLGIIDKDLEGHGMVYMLSKANK